MTPRKRSKDVSVRLAKDPTISKLKIHPRELADLVHMQAIRLAYLAVLCDSCPACQSYDGPALREMAGCLDTLDDRLRKHPHEKETHGNR